MITTKADSRKRLVVPLARTGQVYAIQNNPDGSFTLTAVKPVKAGSSKCRLVKKGGFTVAVPGQPINEDAIQELLGIAVKSICVCK